MIEKKKPTYVELQDPHVRDSEIGVGFSEVLEQIMHQNVELPIQALERIRFVDENTDQNVLIETCRLLGFDLTRDVLNLSVDRFTSIVNQLPLYNDYNGRDEFVKFLSLILGSPASIEPLFTQNYSDFFGKPKGKMIHQGGSWYKTTHVNLTIKRDNLARVYLSPGQTLLSRVESLFYDQAPITLVLKRVIFTTDASITFLLGGTVGRARRLYKVGHFPTRIIAEPLLLGGNVGRTVKRFVVKTSESQ